MKQNKSEFSEMALETERNHCFSSRQVQSLGEMLHHPLPEQHWKDVLRSMSISLAETDGSSFNFDFTES